MKITKELVKQARALLVHNGGFTLPLDGKPCTGYAVACTDLLAKNLTTGLCNALAVAEKLNTNERVAVGGWKDKERGYCIDATLLIDNKEKALTIAQVFNQKAIWDFANSQEVFIS